MAGMFYSLQEVAEKLNKTEQQIQQIVKEGKLQEFRDGENVLFKVDEVDLLAAETGAIAAKEVFSETEQASEQEISLAQEAQEESEFPELTDADTVISSSKGDLTAETNLEFDLSEETTDAMGDTKIPSGTDGTTEASLEEIEEDVNLDTFGTGSGLLDLSLQADDTSLGGILDEIYTSEGSEAGPAVEQGASAMDVAADAEQMLSEEQLEAGPQAAIMAQVQVEPQPDTVSNALGIMLFLPLLAVIYTAVVTVAGAGEVMPPILRTISGIIWYIAAAIAVAAASIVGIAFMLSSSGGKPAKAPKKPKKTKKAKAEKPSQQ